MTERIALFSLLAGFAPCLLNVVPARAELVGYYTFDAEDGTDMSGFANHGTVGTAVSFSTDTPTALGGKSAVADGSGSSLITAANSPSLESIADQLTIALWVKADPSANANWVRLARKGDEEGNNGTPAWMVNRNNDGANAYIRIDSEPAGFNQNRGNGGAIFDSTWHHLAYTLDNGSVEEWIDGEKTASQSYANASVSNTGSLYLLGRPSGVLNGLMDDVSIWSHRLEQDEIELLAGGASALSLLPNEEPFRILSIVRNSDKTVTLTWVSDPLEGTNFTVRYTPDFSEPSADWPDDNDYIPTGGDITTYTTENSFEEDRMFFVVEENPLAVED